MHKLTKGLKKTKKKKKGKKKGREDELFDAAELEEYRRTHQQQQQPEDSAQEHEQGAEADEWRQFKALTAGVDTVLRKTQDDLDRIRSTSYFQRKKPESSEKEKDKDGAEHPTKKADGGAKKWVGFEEGAGGPDAAAAEEEASAEPSAEAAGEASGAASAAPRDLLSAPEAADLLEESAAEESSEEEEDEEDDGLFDTSYVDAVTSGEVKLAYIPDSPELEVSGGADDPFDTSYVEGIAKQAEEDLKKRPAVVLDFSVVKVLAGRAPPASSALKRPSPSPKRQPRAADVDLLLASFDENGNAPAAASEGAPVEPAPKSLLDDLDDVPTSAPASQAQPPPPSHPLLIDAAPSSLATPAPDHDPAAAAADDQRDPQQPGSDLRDLVAEFDLISTAPDSNSAAVLAAPAVLSEPSVTVQVADFPGGQDNEEEDLDDEFAALAKESVSRKASYQPPADGADQQPDPDLDPDLGLDLELDLGLERDPFDTSVAAAVLGDQTAHDSFDSEVAGLTDQPPALTHAPLGQGRKPRAFPISPDVDIVLASDSPSSWAAFDDDGEEPPVRESKPARPPPPAARGQQETFHESELRALAQDLVAPDPFDTSFAEGILPVSGDLRVLEEQLLQGNQDTSVLSNVSIHVTDPAGEQLQHSPSEGELHSLTPGHRDLLGGSTTDLSKLGHDPIEPAAGAADADAEEASCSADPFDTSVVERVAAPGRAELRYLEEELLGDVAAAPERRLSDPDFDPRAAEHEAQQQATAVVQEVVVEAEAAVQKRPDLLGATKVVSFDLPTPSERPDLLAVEEDKAPIAKPLTPYYPEPKTILDDIAKIADPFDTSFAENIAPGRAELRLLENELLEERPTQTQTQTQGQPQIQAQPTLRHSLSDPDFDPRGEEATQQHTGAEPAAGSPEPPPSAAAGAAGRRRSELVRPAPPPADASLRRRFSDVTGDRGPSVRARALQPPDSLPLALSPIQGSRPDLLLVEEEDAAATAKPLTPISRGGGPVLPVSDDPFDTSSVAGNLLPGKAELKVLESELIGGPLKRSYTDPDFDPRASDPQGELDQPQPQQGLPDQRPPTPDKPDLLNLPPAEAQLAHKPLTPTDSLPETAAPPVDGCDIDDPFDTSIVDVLVAPGRAELRALESELIG